MGFLENHASLGSLGAIAMVEGMKRREECGRRGRHVGDGQVEVGHCLGDSGLAVYRCDGGRGFKGCHEVYTDRASSS